MPLAAVALYASLFSGFLVPVDTVAPWVALSYRNIPANTLAIVDGALTVRVDRSSSPLVYRFEKPLAITGFTVDASWEGRLDLPDGSVQGEAGADDFVLKFGLVEAGDRTLNWLQRRIAADWILRLHELAPKDRKDRKGRGIRRISFYSTTQQGDQVGTARRHPLSDLLYEERILHLGKSGPFRLSRRFDRPVETLGLWLSADGDDTGSAFTLKIRRIALELAEPD